MFRTAEGVPYPLGATWDGRGVNFALFSQNATAVELNLFQSPSDGEALLRIPLARGGADVWHIYVEGLQPGALHGYRVDGPYVPREGHRFNRHKLLLDPYAKSVTGPVAWHDSLNGYTVGDPREDLSFDDRDSAAHVPKCVVVDTRFDWGGDAAPRTPWEKTVLYECHVKGMTALHPAVPPELRGTYLGLAAPPILNHLLELGVTAVELLPVHHFVDQQALARRGLRNYWGYHSVSFFAPEARYASGGDGRQVNEFKAMVRAFHEAGIEVILDVVYNHTGEGDRLGPTLSMRGLDNASYYRLKPADFREYENFTGCGNTLNLRHPRVLQCVMDSLRYWVRDMHVDGFRFDLAPVLIRNDHGVDSRSTFWTAVQQDPVLAGVKLIAEPWDLGPDGYQLGRFAPWAEWNDQYRDSVRRFWRGDSGQLPTLASRVAGSRDLFGATRRGPCAGINFVTCHDGFTLADLTSYEAKHNEANGEDNRDGHNENYSRNWGVEGSTEDPAVLCTRERVRRSLLATLLLSRGVPMLSAGDELGRSQRGNNNAYCQDNETSWLDWRGDESRRRLLAFVQRLTALRRRYESIRRDEFFYGVPAGSAGLKDVTWLRADGREMGGEDWHDANRMALGMMVHRPGGSAPDSDREALRTSSGETLLLLLNGGSGPCNFRLPTPAGGRGWRELINTATWEEGPRAVEGGIVVEAHALVLLEAEP
jgi:glycogen operon protein